MSDAMTVRMMFTNEKCPNCDGRGTESDGADCEEVECWQCKGWRKITVEVPVVVPPPSPQPQEAKGERSEFEVKYEVTAVIDHVDFIQQVADDIADVQYVTVVLAHPQPAAPLDTNTLSDATPQDDTVEKFVSDMPKLVEEAWRHEEKIAAGALRYPRTDYACQHLGKLIIDWIRHREERKPR